MFMIVVLHVLGQGGILEAAEPQSAKYWTAWSLKIACYCAVNCFALISGFVMYRSKPRISRAVSLWLQTLFYTLSMAVIFLILKPQSINFSTVWDAVFPVTRNHYWYISAYIGVLVLSPLLNTAIAYTPKRTFDAVLIAAFAAFALLPIVAFANPYGLAGGYSLLWLALLYLVGGYIGKYGIHNQVKTSNAWILIGIALVLSFLSKFLLETFPQLLPLSIDGNILISYTSPTFIAIGVCLLIICTKLSFRKPTEALIRFLSPAALGVYLVHTNRFIWEHVIAGFSRSFVEYPCILLPVLVLLSAMGIYFICTVIELLRIRLFKLLKLDKLCNFIETRITQHIVQYSKQ